MSRLIKLYGIAVGDIYVAADGSNYFRKVVDVTTYSYCDDVIVVDCDADGNAVEDLQERRIDAFKLHMCRYSLYKKG